MACHLRQLCLLCCALVVSLQLHERWAGCGEDRFVGVPLKVGDQIVFRNGGEFSQTLSPCAHLNLRRLAELRAGGGVRFIGECRARCNPLPQWAMWALGYRLDLNRSSAGELTIIKGIGRRTAEKIVAFRRRHGPFKQLVDLRRVRGIGPKKLSRFGPFLAVKDAACQR